MPEINGLHHVTAIASDPQRNIDFYTGFLGLRLVKRTVNFDEPGTYHLYYGDATGRPGTILTFFPFADAGSGKVGAGMASAIAFRIPKPALTFWMERLAGAGMDFEGPDRRFDQDLIALQDPDGMRIELIATPEGHEDSHDGSWNAGPIPKDQAISSIHSVTLQATAEEATIDLLTRVFHYRVQGRVEGRTRLVAPGSEAGRIIDLVARPDGKGGRMGAGSFHHIALRTKDDAEQARWLETLKAEAIRVTPVQDRHYFNSIYFPEPGGILFEIATDPPGFTVDEAIEVLGTSLKLPPALEPQRARIERTLPPLHIPGEEA